MSEFETACVLRWLLMGDPALACWLVSFLVPNRPINEQEQHGIVVPKKPLFNRKYNSRSQSREQGGFCNRKRLPSSAVRRDVRRIALGLHDPRFQRLLFLKSHRHTLHYLYPGDAISNQLYGSCTILC